MTITPPPPQIPEQAKRQGFSLSQVILMLVVAMLIVFIATIVSIKILFFPGPFKPVELSQKEEQQLSRKIEKIESLASNTQPTPTVHNQSGDQTTPLTPEKYTEEGASREIFFNERELNAMLAKNTDLAEKMAIDLAQDMLSLKLLIPLDPDFPIMGGKTLRVTAGAELAYRDGRPVIKLKGVSLMGIPMPNAWLGGIKNIDLVEEYGGNSGFWKSFADGVEAINVVDGSIRIKLKE